MRRAWRRRRCSSPPRETHRKKNINKSIAEALSRRGGGDARRRSRPGMRVRGYLSVVWGCPYEGTVPVRARGGHLPPARGHGHLPAEPGDTIGVGTPRQTEEILDALLTQHVPVEQLALHLHDTRGHRAGQRAGGAVRGRHDLRCEHRRAGRLPLRARARRGTSPPRTWCSCSTGWGWRPASTSDKLVEAGEVAQELIGRKLAGKYLQAALGERDRAQARRRTVPAQ